MPLQQPVLDIADARPIVQAEDASAPSVTLRLMPGDLALIDLRQSDRTEWFADLCCGVVGVSEGSVRFLGRDWAAMPRHYAAALRGRIGRVFAFGGWVEFIDTETNILLPQLHHTRRDIADLREAAAQLAGAFGLPGLPLGRPGDLSPADRARAACVRAFLGEPALVLLESPIGGQFADLMAPLLNAAAAVRSAGGAALWLTRSDLVWNDRSFPATHRLRLRERGLATPRAAA